MRLTSAFTCTLHAGIKLGKFLVAACLLVLPVTLRAQGVSFAGLQSTLPVTGLTAPIAVALDAAGNRYIVNHLAPNVIEVSASGIQTVIPVALTDPRSIAVDGAANLYVADYATTAIVKISAGGVVTSVGDNMAHPASVAVDSAGNLYIAETGHTRVLKVGAGGSPQTVVGAGLFTFVNPVGLAVDANSNLYVSDIGAGVQSLFEVAFAGALATKSILLSGLTDQPNDIAFVSAGEILLSGGSSHQLTLHQLGAGPGPAGPVYQLGSSLVRPMGVAVDPTGRVYVADQNTSAPAVDIIAPGSVDLGQANLCPSSGTQTVPCSLTLTLNFNVASGTSLTSVAAAIVTQGGQNLDFTATVDPLTGIGNTCTGTLTGPTTCSIPIAFNPLAPGIRLGAAELTGIVGSSPTANALASVPLHGLGMGPLVGFDAGVINTLPLSLASTATPSSVIADSSGGLYFVDNAACVVEKLSPGGSAPIVVAGSGTCGSPSGSLGPATSAVFTDPWRIVLNGRGDLYISDDQANVIWKVDALTQVISTVAGQPGAPGYSADGVLAVTASLDTPYALALDSAGDLYFSDYHYAIVRKIDAATGVLSTVAGNYNDGAGYAGDGGAATSAQLKNPIGLALDSSGDFYIADAGNDVIREVTAGTGIITTVAGTAGTAGYGGDNSAATGAELSNPKGIAVDAAGNLYIADSGNYAVRKVSVVPISSTASAGTITTVAGTAALFAQYTGDGGAANRAGLSDVADVTVDGSGNLYLADSSNHAIREITSASGVVNLDSSSIGAASPAIDVVVTNIGNAPLAFSSVVAGANFTLGGAATSCTASSLLSAGAACVLGVEFLPTTIGALTGTIVLTDDAGNNPASTQTLALSGSGTLAPTQIILGAVPATIITGANLGTILASIESSDGSVVISSSATVTATITGPGAYSHMVSAAAVSGVASLDLAGLPLSVAGAYTVTASSSGLTPASATVIASLPATQLAVSGIPSAVAAGGNLGKATATVESADGTVITTNSTAVVTSTVIGPGGYSQRIIATAVDGVVTLDFTSLPPLVTAGTYIVSTSSPYLTSLPSQFSVIVTTQAFTLTAAGSTPGSTPTQTVAAGSAATFTFTLAPTSITLPATFTASGLPPGAIASFSPATLMPPTTTVTTLTIQTAAAIAALRGSEGIGTGLGGIAMGILLLPFAASRKLRKAACRLPRLSLLPGLVSLGAICGLAGCGGGTTKTTTRTPQTYIVTVTAASGATSGSTTVTLVVQ